MPNVQCLKVYIEDPLNKEEWNNLIAVGEQTQ